MRWRVRVTHSALRQFRRLAPTADELESIAEHLDQLESSPLPADKVPFVIERDLLYFDVKGFRCIFELRHSKLRVAV